YDWPGNVRELQNVIERAAVLSSGPVLELDLRWLQLSGAAASPSLVDASTPTHAEPPSPAASLEDHERRHIISTLERTNWVIEGEHGAARLLGLKPSTVRSRMKRLGIARTAAE